MLEVSSRARRAEFLAANTTTARAVAGYLSVVAPVDRGGSEFQLIAMLSAVHTLAASPRWHRGIQVAWGNSPLLSDSLRLAPLDTTTRRILADPSGTAVVERAGRAVALVPLLDRDLGYPIGWVAAWGMLAPEGSSPASMGLLLLIAVAAAPALVLPAALLSNRTRWWLVIVASTGVTLLAVQENHRVRQLASRREAMVLGRVQQLVERASTMPRIDESRLVRLAPGWRAGVKDREPADSLAGRLEADSPGEQRLRVLLRSGSVLEIGPSPRESGWSSFERALAGGVGGFMLSICLAAWVQTRVHRHEKAEDSENGTPLRN